MKEIVAVMTGCTYIKDGKDVADKWYFRFKLTDEEYAKFKENDRFYYRGMFGPFEYFVSIDDRVVNTKNTLKDFENWVMNPPPLVEYRRKKAKK